MTETYEIKGMGCAHCTAKVKEALLKMPHVIAAEVTLKSGEATIVTDAVICAEELKQAVAAAGHYELVNAKLPSNH